MCPHKLLIMHLKYFITDDVDLGREVILTVNANNHVVKVKLTKQLQNLGLVEAYFNDFKHTCPASCFRDRHHIDGVWEICNIVYSSMVACPFIFGAGDHRTYAV